MSFFLSLSLSLSLFNVGFLRTGQSSPLFRAPATPPCFSSPAFVHSRDFLQTQAVNLPPSSSTSAAEAAAPLFCPFFSFSSASSLGALRIWSRPPAPWAAPAAADSFLEMMSLVTSCFCFGVSFFGVYLGVGWGGEGESEVGVFSPARRAPDVVQPFSPSLLSLLLFLSFLLLPCPPRPS